MIRLNILYLQATHFAEIINFLTEKKKPYAFFCLLLNRPFLLHHFWVPKTNIHKRRASIQKTQTRITAMSFYAR